MLHMQANAPVATLTMFDSNLENIGGKLISLGLVFLPYSFSLFTMSGKMDGICNGHFMLSNIFTGKVCSGLLIQVEFSCQFQLILF